MTRLLLIRHGESVANRQGIFAGHIDPELESKGVQQARLTAQYIADNYKVDKIYASDLQRAYKTAMCLGELLGLEVTPKEGLREIYGGEWEGVKFDDLVSLYPKEYDVWINRIEHSGCVGGETVKELGERVMKTLTEIAEENEGKTVAVATHATPVRVSQCIIEKGTLEGMKDVPWVSNASVTVFEYVDKVWKVISVSEDEHLAELRTSLPSNV